MFTNSNEYLFIIIINLLKVDNNIYFIAPKDKPLIK